MKYEWIKKKKKIMKSDSSRGIIIAKDRIGTTIWQYVVIKMDIK